MPSSETTIRYGERTPFDAAFRVRPDLESVVLSEVDREDDEGPYKEYDLVVFYQDGDTPFAIDELQGRLRSVLEEAWAKVVPEAFV